MPPAAEYFIGTVNGELVCHLAVCPFFQGKSYRATRLVVMPEWQGAGVGTRFLDWVCQYHVDGRGRRGKKFGVLFHTSHPQLCSALRRSKKWVQKSQSMFGANKTQSRKSISKATKNAGGKSIGTGYGGHFRAVQGFKYIGNK